MITRFAHACILCRDLEPTDRFYCDVLGLQKAFDFEKAGERIGFYLRSGDSTFIEVFRGDAGSEIIGPLRHFCLETDNIDEMRERLLAHGYEASEKKFGCDNAWQIWTKDPNGIGIEIMQYTPESLQFRGGVAKIE